MVLEDSVIPYASHVQWFAFGVAPTLPHDAEVPWSPPSAPRPRGAFLSVTTPSIRSLIEERPPLLWRAVRCIGGIALANALAFAGGQDHRRDNEHEYAHALPFVMLLCRPYHDRRRANPIYLRVRRCPGKFAPRLPTRAALPSNATSVTTVCDQCAPRGPNEGL
jgi:hypothetical protein